MNTKNNLTISMFLLFLFTFVSFGIIIINEKKVDIMLPKIDDKLNNYVNSNYKNILSNVVISDTKYKKNYFYKKIYNKNNKNLYFIVKYKNRKISSTYDNDYIEGKTLLDYLKRKSIKKISNSDIYTNISINFTKSYDKYSNLVQDKLLKSDDISDLSIYSIKCGTTVDNFNVDNITLSIKNFYLYTKSNSLNPKSYSLVITNKNNITEAIEISNLDENIINNHLNEIIYGIINKDSNIINTYNVTYKYLN